MEFNHCVVLLKGFSSNSLETDSFQIHAKDCLLGFFLCFLHFLFQFLPDFLFRKDREHFQNSTCSLKTEQIKSDTCKALVIQKLTKVSTSLIYSLIAEPKLLTWQAKILLVRSVARVTTRSLPSRMMDPTLLHFTRRYKERRRTTLV